ncbi:MAG: MCD, Malonyl-CoA decarboxylase MCD [Salinarimonadaceae bacterium]|nr:MAG: MCD, Malonyl-CoA decarboxylase MCD [Salinarimonadaceae bacterium]
MVATMSFFTDMLQQIADRGRTLISPRRPSPRSYGELRALAEALLTNRGEVSGVARAAELLDGFAGASAKDRDEFLRALALDFGPDEAKVEEAIAAYRAEPGPHAAMKLHVGAEPRRQELLRKLNRTPGGTLALLRMREETLARLSEDRALADLDADFRHLFSSWFNRGFLGLKRIDWTSPAHVLEKIIRYEAVHKIENFEELKSRLAPEDRRLYAFFHPALTEEPLIFVEVALTQAIPGAIAPILDPAHEIVPEKQATTAVFYSISNCQKGLAGVSFGNFLIKQVVEELRRDLPQLRTFVTLSPVPGFAQWLRTETADAESAFLGPQERAALAPHFSAQGEPDFEALAAALHGDLGETVRTLAATYLVHVRSQRESGLERPRDPVARFHLGNGARLEHVHAQADMSRKGLAQGAGVMVNYLYDLDAIERNHEAYAERGEVAVSSEVRRLAKPHKALRELAAGR